MDTLTPIIDSPRPITVDEALEQIDRMVEDAITPRCEIEDDAPQCGAPAAWIVILSCGHSVFECAEHAESLRASIAAFLKPGHALVCDIPLDRSPWHPRPMKVTVRFERIAS